MGNINFGVPAVPILFLKELYKSQVFVETGTFRGDSALKMAKIFEKVVTIENSKTMYELARDNLKGKENIEAVFGDTQQLLPKIVGPVKNGTFWLDAHYSGGATYGLGDECPLIVELCILFQECSNPVILIDDARLFLAPPPLPHERKQWPDIVEIVKTIPLNYKVFVFDDVIYLIPGDKEAELFGNFLQGLSSKRYQSKFLSLLDRVYLKLSKLTRL